MTDPSPGRRSTTVAGFIMVEVLAALLLAGLLGTAAATSLLASTRRVAENRRSSEAIVFAQDVLEDLRAVPYDHINSGSRNSEDGLYSLSWEVETDPALIMDGPRERGMKLIRVTVSWPWMGETRSQELTTIFARVTPDF